MVVSEKDRKKALQMVDEEIAEMRQMSFKDQFNEYLNDYQTYLTGKTKNVKKAREFLGQAINLARLKAKTPKFKKFVADALFEAAKVAERAKAEGLIPISLGHAVNYTKDLKPKTLKSDNYQQLLDYVGTRGFLGNIQDLNIKGVMYNSSDAEKVRFNSPMIRADYIRRKKEEQQGVGPKENKIKEKDVSDSAQKLWNSLKK